MKYCLLFLLPIASLASWAPEWNNLTGYDRSKRYVVTADVQQITREIFWTNPVTMQAQTKVQTYIAVARPDATSELLELWHWTNYVTETVEISWNGQVLVVPALIRIVSKAVTGQQISVSVADRLLLDVYEALLERMLAVNLVREKCMYTNCSKRDLIGDWYKPAFYGAPTLARLGPAGREHFPMSYLQDIKIGLKIVMDSYVNTQLFYESYITNPIPAVRNWQKPDLLSAIGAPSNYFEYTPPRDWEGSWLTYGSVITGRWVLERPLVYDFFEETLAPATTNNVFTNVVIDACGNVHEIVGTNGQVVTYICENTAIADGFTAADYGLKYIKQIISSLYLTERPIKYFAPQHKVTIKEYTEDAIIDDWGYSDFWRRIWDRRHYANTILSEVKTNVLSQSPPIGEKYSVEIWRKDWFSDEWGGRVTLYTSETSSGLYEGDTVYPTLEPTPNIALVVLESNELQREEPLTPPSFCSNYNTYYVPGTVNNIQWVSSVSFTAVVNDVTLRFIGSPMPVPSLCGPPDDPPPVLDVSPGASSGYYEDGPAFPQKILIMNWKVPNGFRYQ